MLEIVFKFFTYLFAFYGLYLLIIQLFNGAFNRMSLGDKKIEPVLFVKDCEDVIENVLMDSYTNGLAKQLILGGRTTVIDMGSRDKTVDILNKLKRKNEGLNIIIADENEKEKVSQYFDEILYKR